MLLKMRKMLKLSLFAVLTFFNGTADEKYWMFERISEDYRRTLTKNVKKIFFNIFAFSSDKIY